MTTSETTTIRVPLELRDEIARIADARDSTMLDVVADAVRRLAREEWWSSVHGALDNLPPAAVNDLAKETELLDRAAEHDLRG